MICREMFRDFSFVVFVSLVVVLFNFVFGVFLGFDVPYFLSLGVFLFLLSFSFCVVPRFGFAVLFSLVYSLLTWSLVDFGVVGKDKVLLFFAFALVFELVFFFFRFFSEEKSVGILPSSAFAAAFIPFVMGALLSVDVLIELLHDVINLSLVSFFVGLIASLISLFIWYYVRTFRFFLRFQYF